MLIAFVSMKVICFDLDDTLYKEIDYLTSAYREIAQYAAAHCLVDEDSQQRLSDEGYLQMMTAYQQGENAFAALNSRLGLHIPVSDYLTLYRKHVPKIVLSDDVKQLLEFLHQEGVILGLITDGRSVQQRNKLKALGLDSYLENENIVISEEFGSEKPALANYTYFMQRYPACHDFTYVGDNLKKDFLTPNRLGWRTVCLRDDGRNIHKQDGVGMTEEMNVKIWIDRLSELAKLSFLRKR